MPVIPIRRARLLLVLAALLLTLAPISPALATASTVLPAGEMGGFDASSRGAEVVAVTQVADRQVGPGKGDREIVVSYARCASSTTASVSLLRNPPVASLPLERSGP
ncbi:hypothetical protein ABT115_04495 [Streptomyces sp. NPDC001832]|uniref:hypothetical protein n=1 Tax=Streptomyces sp. NPDC001832 TaxID=3154527 RepID=UPI00332965E5